MMDKPILNHFYTYDEICEYLSCAQKAYPDLMELKELARTEENRVIWGITMSKGDADKMPALYVQGGIHAQEGMGITCCLNFLWTVLENPQILDKIAIYILPCVNPDGSDICVRTGLDVRSKLEYVPGVTNGLVPQDVDGDGKILFMRWEDPTGFWVSLPECGDILVPRRPGDKGPFYTMVREGLVENYDGGELRSAYRDLDFNRQYALDWKDNLNGGDYPTKHVESRTIMSFLSSHPNIYTVLDCHCGTRGLLYHTPDNLTDSRLMKRLTAMGNAITGMQVIPHSRYGARADGPASVLRGHIDSYCYDALGIPSITVELGNGYNSLGMAAFDIFEADLNSRELISKLVAMHGAKGRKIAEPWKPYHHPQLGDVEVGGKLHGDAYHMDPDEMLDLLPKLADYFLQIADLVPELKLADVTCDALGGDVYRIRAKVMNISGYNTKIMQGATGYHANKDGVEVKLTGAHEVLNSVANPRFACLYPMEQKSMEWFVRGNTGDVLTLKALHPKCIVDECKIILP